MRATGNNTLLNRRLSIRLSTDGFSFCTLKGWQHHTVDNGEELCEKLDNAIRKLLKLKTEYSEVMLLADYPSTRVPLDEFRSESEQSIYLLTFGDESLQGGLTIQHETIPALDVVELFPIDVEAKDTVMKHFPAATVQGFCAQTIQESYADYKKSNGEGKRLYATVEGKDMFICAFAGKSLSFANSYPERQADNRLYFILYAWTQLRMDQEKDILVLYGEDAELEQLLRKYIRNVRCV